MAFDFTQFLQATAPIAGAAGGAGLAGTIGTTPQAGLLGGLAAGQALSSSIGLFQDIPQQMGATGDQQAVLAAQLANLEQASERRGLGAQAIQTIGTARESAKAAQLQEAALIGQQLSPLEAEVVAQGMAERAMAQRIDLESRVAALDERSEAQRIANVTQASAVAAQQAEAIRRADEEARQRQLQLELQKQQNFAKGMSSVATALQGAFKLHGLQSPEGVETPDTAKVLDEVKPISLDGSPLDQTPILSIPDPTEAPRLGDTVVELDTTPVSTDVDLPIRERTQAGFINTDFDKMMQELEVI